MYTGDPETRLRILRELSDIGLVTVNSFPEQSSEGQSLSLGVLTPMRRAMSRGMIDLLHGRARALAGPHDPVVDRCPPQSSAEHEPRESPQNGPPKPADDAPGPSVQRSLEASRRRGRISIAEPPGVRIPRFVLPLGNVTRHAAQSRGDRPKVRAMRGPREIRVRPGRPRLRLRAPLRTQRPAGLGLERYFSYNSRCRFARSTSRPPM